MLRLSTKGRYGLRLLLDLAHFYGQGPVLMREIARRQEISENYLAQLIIPLKTAGLVHSSRGARGGYSLAKPPAEITVRAIVEALEGPLSLSECVRVPAICHRAEDCVARLVWKQTADQLATLLEGITLAELVAQEQRKKARARKKSTQKRKHK